MSGPAGTAVIITGFNLFELSGATPFAGSDSPATSSPTDTTPADIPIPTELSNGEIVLSEQVGASAADAAGERAWSGTAQAQLGTLRIPVSVTYASEASWTVTANETMSIDGNAPIGLVLAARAMTTCAVVVADVWVTESFQATISLSAVGENGTAVWPNIFGVTGLNLNSAAVQIGMTPGMFPYVSTGLAGSGTLPGKLREYMGIDSHAVIPMSFVMNLSAVNPCLSVAVGDPQQRHIKYRASTRNTGGHCEVHELARVTLRMFRGSVRCWDCCRFR